MPIEASCPCGVAETSFASCCGRFIDGEQVPRNAVELMRSRYVAYVILNNDYLRATWHPSSRPVERQIVDESVKWLGLEVKKQATAGNEASIEFVARYRIAGRGHRLHENSRFLRENGRWFYVDGIISD